MLAIPMNGPNLPPSIPAEQELSIPEKLLALTETLVAGRGRLYQDNTGNSVVVTDISDSQQVLCVVRHSGGERNRSEKGVRVFLVPQQGQELLVVKYRNLREFRLAVQGAYPHPAPRTADEYEQKVFSRLRIRHSRFLF